jgi:hypothetical protein
MATPTPAVVGPLLQIGDITDGAVMIPAHEAGGNMIVFQTRGQDCTVDLTIVPSNETQWKYSNTTTMADPNTGNFRANNLTASLVTQFAFSGTSAQGIARANLFNSLEVGDTIYVQDIDLPAAWARFTIATVPTDNTTWFLVPVTYVAASGTGLANNNRCLITFSQSGTGIGGVPADKSYVHNQVTLSASWSVAHALGKFPSVSVVDTGGSVIIPNTQYIDANNVTLTFAAATSGKAYCN